MQANYAPTTAFTKVEEGGYTADPRDSGNWSSGITGQGTLIGSNMGCGAPATIAYMARVQPGFVVTASWMQTLPQAVYDGMAETGYWTPLQGNQLPAGLDSACFDFGWNTGIGSAAKRLQWLVGTSQDGQIGPETLARIAACPLAPIAQALSQADAANLQRHLGVTPDGDIGPITLASLAAQPTIRPVVLLLALGEAQTAYYRSLFNFSIYGGGWISRTQRRIAAGMTLATGTAAAAGAAGAFHPGVRAPAAIEPANATPWHPFEPGLRIAAQAARRAA